MHARIKKERKCVKLPITTKLGNILILQEDILWVLVVFHYSQCRKRRNP